jgi:hypothetical protein
MLSRLKASPTTTPIVIERVPPPAMPHCSATIVVYESEKKLGD